MIRIEIMKSPVHKNRHSIVFYDNLSTPPLYDDLKSGFLFIYLRKCSNKIVQNDESKRCFVTLSVRMSIFVQ